ncbi:MAG: rhomboid family intramembrane serine protease [Candidatus Eisenbacteria bacterium]|nr:rhomboid family intramembrane serine protease [Candidatus Eisenbacteria bacterium]
MIGLRLMNDEGPGAPAASVLWIEDHELEAWVRSGRVGADTWVWAGPWSGGAWKRADDLEVFHLFRPEPNATATPSISLRDTIFPARGLSATEALVLINIGVSAVLLALWREGYTTELWQTMAYWWTRVATDGQIWRWVPTIVMHADAGHLMRNLGALLVMTGGVEVFYGRARTWACYLATGLAAAAVSFWGRGGPPLSVGASGAIFGLAGVLTGFLIRHGHSFNERQRWKARRVYAPLILVLVPPALFHADWRAHLGGYLAGVILGLVLSLGPAGRRLFGAVGATSRPPDDVSREGP